jgi:feruloyl esterase
LEQQIASVRRWWLRRPLVTGLGGVANQVASSPNPLAQGYVTLGSDSGHQGTGFDAAFALNDEALANFGAANQEDS